MKNCIYYILMLFVVISCSEAEKQNDSSDIFNSISEQKRLYYNVEYGIYSASKEPLFNFYGMVSLNKNSDSGISSGYFGLVSKQLPNYLHSMYLGGEWIHNLKSRDYELMDVDILTDSLHSPILINPELLFEIEAGSINISHQKINEKNIKWVFDLQKKPDQLVLIWDQELNKISELEYIYNVGSKNTYSRKWSFDYLSKTEYNELAMEFKHQNQIAQQPFL